MNQGVRFITRLCLVGVLGTLGCSSGSNPETCEEVCDAGDGDCDDQDFTDAEVAECKSSCAALRSTASSTNCSSQFEAFEKCMGNEYDGSKSCDSESTVCTTETDAMMTCEVNFCMANPTDAACS